MASHSHVLSNTAQVVFLDLSCQGIRVHDRPCKFEAKCSEVLPSCKGIQLEGKALPKTDE